VKIIIFAKDKPNHIYVANLQDWLNPDLCTIPVEVPYIGGTDSINKANYEIRPIIDENGEETLALNGGD
jgi:hypothetical protein